MKRAMKRGFSYIRFSDPKQARGDSLRRQKDAEWAPALCRAKGWHLDDSLELEDKGRSAFTGENAAVGALRGFLDAIEEGKVLPGDVLLIESLDRLTRQAIDDAYDLFRGILRRGVEIYTREPERHYTKVSLNNIGSILEVLIYMERAYNESATKSMRGREYWKARRAEMVQTRRPCHKVCPAWLRLSKDKSRFLIIKAAAAAVRLIYQWAGEGWGLNAIVKRLNQEGIPPIGRKPTWRRSYVAKLLQDRAVIGVYQPHVLKDGKRVPHGDPIEGYFPAIIEEDEWYATRRAVKSRFKERGPKGFCVANLFTGLIRDARDGQRMHLQYNHSSLKANARVLVSYGVRNGEVGSVDLPFPYDFLEELILTCLKELKVEDVVTGVSSREQEIAALSGKLEELNHQKAKVQRRYRESSNEALLELLEQIGDEIKKTALKLDNAKAENVSQPATVLGECQSLLTLMDRAEGHELEALRTRVKARIKQLISEIWMIVWDDEQEPTRFRLADLQIFLMNGRVRIIRLRWCRRGQGRGRIVGVGGVGGVTGGPVPEGSDGLHRDLRLWREQGGWRLGQEDV